MRRLYDLVTVCKERSAQAADDSHWCKPGRRRRALIYESGDLPAADTGTPHVPDYEDLIVPFCLGAETVAI